VVADLFGWWQSFSAVCSLWVVLKEVVGLLLAGFAASFAVTVSVFAVSAIMESLHYLTAYPSLERAANLLLFILFAGATLSLADDIAKRAWKRGAPAG